MNSGDKIITGVNQNTAIDPSLNNEVSRELVSVGSDVVDSEDSKSIQNNVTETIRSEVYSPDDSSLLSSGKDESSDVFFNSRQPILKLPVKIFLSRSAYYFLLFVLVSFVPYSNKFNHTSSLAIVFTFLTGNYFILKMSSWPVLFLRYIMFSLNVLDIGVCTFLIFLNGSANNLLILAYPALICSYSMYTIKIDFLFLFVLNILSFWISSITFDTYGIVFFEFKTGILIYTGLLAWIITFNYFMKLLKKNDELRLSFFKFIEKVIDRLPKEIKDKLEVIMSAEKFRILELEFRKKVQEIGQSLYAKDQELKFYKETLQSSIKSGDSDDMDSAVNQVNSLLEIENLSLKENNKKLMELNKTMEERVRSLTSELEIANTELERIYSSLNESQSSDENL